MSISENIFLHGITLKDSSPKHGFPFSIPAITNLNIEFKKTVTFLVGENGSGKSTILEAIADKIGFNAMGGTKHHQFHSDYETELANYYFFTRRKRDIKSTIRRNGSLPDHQRVP
jgi:predicted ATPase